MINIVRTDSENLDFIELVRMLDAELAIRDGDDHEFYDQFNKLDHINHVVVAYENEIPIGCGAIKHFNNDTMEVKRMFTLHDCRGKGLATLVLSELEQWASELSYKKCVLETGINQPEAIRLYEKNGYKLIDNYGQYAGLSTSKCFEKYCNKDIQQFEAK